jgi:hypothetical protein
MKQSRQGRHKREGGMGVFEGLGRDYDDEGRDDYVQEDKVEVFEDR